MLFYMRFYFETTFHSCFLLDEDGDRDAGIIMNVLPNFPDFKALSSTHRMGELNGGY